MFRKCVAAAVLVAGAAFLPGAANAANGFTVERTELRAGPDYDYPTVRVIRDGRNVDIYGCLRDWSWCDVGYRSDRGWVAGEDLVVDYRGRRQGIVTAAPYLGIGVLSFSFGNYWDNYYRGRPFYSERNRWERHYHDHYRPNWGPRPDRRDWNDRDRRDGRDWNDRDRRDNDRGDNDRRDNDRVRDNDNDRARERAEEARRNAQERAREVQQRTAPVTAPKPQAQPQPGLHQRGIERKEPTPDRTPTPAASERRNDRPSIEERRAARPDVQQRPQAERPTAAPQQREAPREREERKPRERPTPDQDEDNRPGR
ncbi:hypothetical protein [Iodidimonas sp. SYSU 1G8]|uniref:SH3 domain-containing protein n=1 Tax=Iodidimonas sp. SYSU 1G8 TaxID=3133967 RepID=UPI0031FEF2D6